MRTEPARTAACAGRSGPSALEQRVPALGLQFVQAALLVHQVVALVGGGGMADHREMRRTLHLVVVGLGDGEEQFVILAAVEGRGGGIEVEFAGGLYGE